MIYGIKFMYCCAMIGYCKIKYIVVNCDKMLIAPLIKIIVIVVVVVVIVIIVVILMGSKKHARHVGFFKHAEHVGLKEKKS